MSVKVSVVCVTYNHKDYIEKAVEGFVIQKTNFEVEVIIGDDKSTDGTAEIVSRLAARHPDLIKPVLRPKNIGVVPNFMDLMKRAKGEYIALCEGDDYWTDPSKLQKQVEFLDAHPDCAVCFHPVNVITEGINTSEIYPPADTAAKFNLEELLKHNFIQTNSAMYRRQKYDNSPLDILPLDWYLHLFHARFGKIGFINEVMSVYRRHPSGLWWESDNNQSKFWLRHGPAHLNFYSALMKMFGDDATYQKIVGNNAINALNEIRQLDRDLYMKSVLKHPDFAGLLAEDLAEKLDRLDKHAQAQEKHINQLQIKLEQSKNELEQSKNETDSLRMELTRTASYRIKKQVKRIIKKD